MKTMIKVTLALLLCVGSAWAYQKVVKRSTFVDEVHGFTIETPKFPGATPTTPGTPLIVTGPPANGFAPNVNVTIQATAITAKAYRDLSVEQFQQLGWKLNSEKSLKVSGRDAIELDYEGTQAGKSLRFLSMAVMDKNRVILLTCSSLSNAFAPLESEFRACLGSFKLP